MPDIERMSMREVIDFLRNNDYKTSNTANSILLVIILGLIIH